MVTRHSIRTWVLGAAGLLAGNLSSSSLELKTSVGYDFVSQEYFLDSVTTDTTLTVWLLESNYLDDFKGRISLSYFPHEDRRLEFQSSYEQSSELYRMKFYTDWRPKIGKSGLDFKTEIERRGRQKGQTVFGDSYVFGYSRAAFITPVSEKTKLRFQVLGEFVNFDSSGEFSYDYYRVGPRIGINHVFGGFSFLDANIFLNTRQVPDSSLLDYLSFGIDGSYLGIAIGGDIDLYTRFERKDYNRPDARDDHFRFDFDGRGKLNLGERYFTRFEFQTEIVLYSPHDPVNFDFGRTGWAALAGVEKAGWSIAAGPAFELMIEQEGSLKSAEDYFEIGGKVDLELLNAGRFFGTFESVLGYRNLSVEEEFQTDFIFQRLNTIGNFTIFGGLNLNWLFSAEWEWHDLKQDNSEIFLLSTNLTYSI